MLLENGLAPTDLVESVSVGVHGRHLILHNLGLLFLKQRLSAWLNHSFFFLLLIFLELVVAIGEIFVCSFWPKDDRFWFLIWIFANETVLVLWPRILQRVFGPVMIIFFLLLLNLFSDMFPFHFVLFFFGLYSLKLLFLFPFQGGIALDLFNLLLCLLHLFFILDLQLGPQSRLYVEFMFQPLT